MPASLPPVVADYLAAVNAFDIDAIMATFAPDAYVNDARREINGVDAIRRWVEKEMVGDHVTMEPLEVVDRYGDTIVRSRYDLILGVCSHHWPIMPSPSKDPSASTT